LNTIPIPAGSNFSSTILTNVGNVENKGVELQINAAIIRSKKLNWEAGFNIAYNDSKITKLTATEDSTYPGTLTGNGVIQINTVGYQPSSFYVYHQEYANGKPVEGVYADVNGDGIINQNDLYRYKSPAPKFVLGFSSQFSYGKWSLTTVLRANIGNYIYHGIATGSVKSNILNPLGYLANSLNDIYNTGFTNGQNQSDYYIKNASFLKMDNLGLVYNAGRIMHDKVGLRIMANCQNVFTVTKYKGLDPEVFGGIDNTIYPRPRTFVLGASLQF
jgi:iron complex outermembrane receptor protein